MSGGGGEGEDRPRFPVPMGASWRTSREGKNLELLVCCGAKVVAVPRIDPDDVSADGAATCGSWTYSEEAEVELDGCP
jgi:hypothetical protein